MRLILALILLVTLGCAQANRVEHWPYRGSLITVFNDTKDTVPVVAHSSTRGGLLVTRALKPMRRITFRWPWIDGNSALLASAYGTIGFQPWDGSLWCWSISQPTVAQGKCPKK